MYPIGHFAVGASVALLVLIFKPEFVPNFIQSDIFFVFALGLFAMIPDMGALWRNFKMDDKPIMDVFIFHRTIDKKFPDDIKASAVAVTITGLLLIKYYGVII